MSTVVLDLCLKWLWLLVDSGFGCVLTVVLVCMLTVALVCVFTVASVVCVDSGFCCVSVGVLNVCRQWFGFVLAVFKKC